jgi:hydroxymethylbilane synthase
LSPPGTLLRIGTRSSALAVWQTERIREMLRTVGQETERVEIKTTGDMTPDVPLARIGSRALFTRQIDEALLEGRIDLAVHSLKDLPTQLPAGIAITAVGAREDPRDALVGHGAMRWDQVPKGGVIATSSLRRRAQILNQRPDLSITDIRGNVDTRVAKLDARSDWAGIVLAVAGLTRLGLAHRIGERLAPEVIVPAPGQGALAITTRSDDDGTRAVVRSAVHDEPTALCVAAERAFLRRMEGGCQIPVGALARIEPRASRMVRLIGRVISLSGEKLIGGEESGSAATERAAEQLGTRLAERLLAEGASTILLEARSSSAPVVSEP